jgi:hypothetical protein
MTSGVAGGVRGFGVAAGGGDAGSVSPLAQES